MDTKASGQSPQWESGVGGGAPKLSKHKGIHVCVPHSGASRLFTGSRVSSTFSLWPMRHHMTWPQSLSSTSFRAPEPRWHCPGPLPAVPVPQTWQVAPCAGCAAEIGWDHGTLCLKVPRAGCSLSSLSLDFSSHVLPGHPLDVSFPPHPSHFLILFSSQHFITELLLLVCLFFLVSLPYCRGNLGEKRELYCLFYHCVWHTDGSQ